MSSACDLDDEESGCRASRGDGECNFSACPQAIFYLSACPLLRHCAEHEPRQEARCCAEATEARAFWEPRGRGGG